MKAWIDDDGDIVWNDSENFEDTSPYSTWTSYLIDGGSPNRDSAQQFRRGRECRWMIL